jgi:imidazolonepropionase-like amidohydrolase
LPTWPRSGLFSGDRAAEGGGDRAGDSRTFRKAQAAGVKIAFGTDSGVSPHGENAREFELMVEGGMPPMKAIQSATLVASQLLRVEDSWARSKKRSWPM